MDVVRFPDDARPVRWPYPVLAIGNFDGLHRGHLKIVERIRRGATERAGTSVVMTFDPHPPRVLRPDKAPPLLMTSDQKRDALARAGVQGLAMVRFTEELSQWEPEAFVRRVLVDWLRVAEVWVGADFLFGRNRSGNFTLLRTLGQQFGFRVEKIDPIRYKDFVVSSTRIRRLVSEGRVEEAGRAARPALRDRGRRGRGRAPRTGDRVFRPRTSRPRTSCCRRAASTRPSARSTGSPGRA